MNRLPAVSFQARCTSCRKRFDVTEEMQREAREVGCVFSACCHAVATIESATNRQRKEPKK